MSRHSPLLSVMIQAVRKAAKPLFRDFGEVENLLISRKGPADFVTQADMKVEKLLREELSRARPGYGLLMEETGAVEGTDKSHRWIVDPIDGTTNFIHGLPHFALSVGLERDGQLVAGVVYNPIADQLFIAEKGQGAYLNDRRIRVAQRRQLDECLIATGMPFKGKPGQERFAREVTAVLNQTAGVRRFGSAALDLAYVAAGRYDGYWERGLNPWDVAAGIVLVREAGGFVREIEGGDNALSAGSILATNEPLLTPLSDLLKSA